MKLKVLLNAIGSTEPTTFSELCDALGPDKPEKDDKRAWYILFELIRRAEEDGDIVVDRDGRTLNSVMLTADGVARLANLNKER